jgi:alanine dehydrogenase
MSAHRPATLLLTRGDVRRLLPLSDCVDAVEAAFRRSAEAQDPPPRILGMHVQDGGFHAKAAVSGHYFATKLNANFPLNPGRTGLPTIQGVVILADTRDGRLLAIMDSIEITILRTAAATALAARYLARPDAAIVTVCGCGVQGAIQLEALVRARAITRAFAYDSDRTRAEQFARTRATALGIVVEAVDDLGGAVRRSDIVVTCTSAREVLIHANDVQQGTFIAAVGADSEEKQELDPTLLTQATVVVDSLEQCATIGELHHALEARLLTRASVHAELGEVIAGRRPGRASAHEIAIFDSTGTALQDVAAAAMVYERALVAGAGTTLDLSL